jgi:hypothetical protein
MNGKEIHAERCGQTWAKNGRMARRQLQFFVKIIPLPWVCCIPFKETLHQFKAGYKWYGQIDHNCEKNC